MRFYFPDSQDLVSPTYDFIHDEYSPLRVRQRDDRYAHEVLDERPYDGMLVSKAIVDGSVRGSGKYSEAQRHRLYRLGVQRFFRLPDGVDTLGDCGAFNYADEDEPPYTVDEVLDFYVGCGFRAGISIDHVILAYDRDAGDETADPEWKRRQAISLDFGERFLAASEQYDVTKFQPVGAAQGWSPASYARSVAELQSMGYRRIALGGMVPLKTKDILECLNEIDAVRSPGTELHLLGVTRVDSIDDFAQHGVTSFDSTSPFRQSFMDDRKNYHTEDDAYVAIRVPQVDANPTLKRAILAGKVSGRDAVAAEREALAALRGFDAGTHTVADVLTALSAYEAISQAGSTKKSYIDRYARTLGDSPWRSCPCTLCLKHGIEIIIFRGTERNKRRGFHNLSVLERKMRSLKWR
ncbi:tRNA-guanine transglycosylase DpdA [Cellulosimicrobium cellulans]|uniref:tRNA-guanine transglycosylase DpdA n=1 Tax=Cellulosimicrobium cellulans TaxID=1710 RepID=UPI0028ADEEE0|nr:tRNA-guanine transglycosylase DpdA [Cellulosimicrobium cellulans]